MKNGLNDFICKFNNVTIKTKVSIGVFHYYPQDRHALFHKPKFHIVVPANTGMRKIQPTYKYDDAIKEIEYLQQLYDTNPDLFNSIKNEVIGIDPPNIYIQSLNQYLEQQDVNSKQQLPVRKKSNNSSIVPQATPGEKLIGALNCNYFIEVFDVCGNKISELLQRRRRRLIESSKIQLEKNVRSSYLRNIYRFGMHIAETEEKHKGQLAIRDKVIVIKDKHIVSLKEHLEKETGDTIDLTVEDDSDGEVDSEPMKKRPRPNSDIPKKSLASILLDEKSDKLVQVKEEKIVVETALEDTKEDLEDTLEDFGNQVLYVNFLQGKIDELAELAEGAGADRSNIAEIKGRLYSSR